MIREFDAVSSPRVLRSGADFGDDRCRGRSIPATAVVRFSEVI